MSSCISSFIIHPWPLIHEPPETRWTSLNPNRPLYPLTLRLNSSSKLTAGVFQQGVGLVSPDDVSLPHTKEPEDIHGAVNGVADTKVQEETVDFERVSTTRVKKKRVDEESFDDRFKLRNGREVFEEKAYLVGVECKGDSKDSFGREESLKELAQLADTAGLMVVGSTSQKFKLSEALSKFYF